MGYSGAWNIHVLFILSFLHTLQPVWPGSTAFLVLSRTLQKATPQPYFQLSFNLVPRVFPFFFKLGGPNFKKREKPWERGWLSSTRIRMYLALSQ